LTICRNPTDSEDQNQKEKKFDQQENDLKSVDGSNQGHDAKNMHGINKFTPIEEGEQVNLTLSSIAD